jgi:hypothetical protein
MRPGFWLWALILLGSGQVATPDKPDFSGQWVLVSSSDAGTTVARELTVHQSIVRETVRGDAMPPFFKTLTVERRFSDGVRSASYEIGMTGGTVRRPSITEPTNGQGCTSTAEPTRTVWRVTWDADRLVIQTASYSCPTPDVGPYTEHDETWSLDSEGRLLITVTDGGSSRSKTTSDLIYRRQ